MRSPFHRARRLAGQACRPGYAVPHRVHLQDDDGKVDLDADVSGALGFTLRNPRFPDQPITLGHLLTDVSRSGIARLLKREGQKKRPELFVKRVYDQTGLVN
jgi:CubicO group peptidase (beta-lactamase class C family)